MRCGIELIPSMMRGLLQSLRDIDVPTALLLAAALVCETRCRAVDVPTVDAPAVDAPAVDAPAAGAPATGISADRERYLNAGGLYNRDRGPVSAFAARVHTQF